MTPLHVVATLRGPLAVRSVATLLDALLGSAIAQRDGLPVPNRDASNLAPLDIPLAREPTNRFYLATQGFGHAERHELRHKNRRFPLGEALMMSDRRRTSINLQGGPCRSYRIPLETVHLVEDRIEWWAVGHVALVERLLVDWISFLGHRRGVGFGPVARWLVEPCEPWGAGFPVLRDGAPLRQLPLDTPGVATGSERAFRCVDQPYWRRWAEELCAVPS